MITKKSRINPLIDILIVSRQIEDQQRIINTLPENDFLIADTDKDESGAIIKSERLKPDVLILDLKMSLINYPELARIIRRRSPSTAIIILSEKEENNILGFMLKAGINGFLLKEEDIDKLAYVVKIIHLGGYYISASIFSRIINETVLRNPFPEQITEQDAAIFSPVERGIVTDLANGFSDGQIAKHFNYSEGSIKNILSFLKRRTKLKSRVQLVVFALISGLIRFENLWMCRE